MRARRCRSRRRRPSPAAAAGASGQKSKARSCWRYHCFGASGSVGVNATRRLRAPSHSAQRTPSMRRTPRDAAARRRRARRSGARPRSTVPYARSCCGDARQRRSRIDADREARRIGVRRAQRAQRRLRPRRRPRGSTAATTFGDSADGPAVARRRRGRGRRRRGADGAKPNRPVRDGSTFATRRPAPSPPSCWIWTEVPGSDRPHDALDLREVGARPSASSSGATTTLVEGVVSALRRRRGTRPARPP